MREDFVLMLDDLQVISDASTSKRDDPILTKDEAVRCGSGDK